MSTAMALGTTPLAITAAGVITPAGLGLERLGAALAEGRVAPGDASAVTEASLPPRPIQVVPHLPVEELLGRKGNRQLDRTTKLALIATRLALDVAGARGTGPATTAHSGVVLGTSTGSIRSSSEYSRETLELEKPYLVNPGLFPNTVMNCAAGQIAIRNDLHGVNATLAGGHLSGLQAIRYARNALRQGHADRLLVGGVEEFCAQSAWGWHSSGALSPDAAIGEAVAMLLVEPLHAVREEDRIAQILACDVAFGPQAGREAGGLAAVLARVIGEALERSGVQPAEVDTVSLGASGQVGLERIEERGVRAALGGTLPPQVIRVKRVLGECFSAGGAIQIAAVLAQWQGEDAAEGRHALVTSVGADGSVGCLVLRR
ncbi:MULTISPECIES: beta-ketoacyl synthase N-terminal-like domain-containing protein [unclassified Streptomyces]|uniref:beta-ketoacyl synthase N-terminal-like domain-containing protein n=1 Tax=unclassified Streptomyces TaxID=2593676 RepID=UPI003823BD41